MNARKVRQRRRERQTFAAGDYAIQLAATMDGKRHSERIARLRTHNLLIAGLGDRRRSGVRWLMWGAKEGLDILDRHFPGAQYDDIRQVLRDNPRGSLVAALAKAVKA